MKPWDIITQTSAVNTGQEERENQQKRKNGKGSRRKMKGMEANSRLFQEEGASTASTDTERLKNEEN